MAKKGKESLAVAALRTTILAIAFTFILEAINLWFGQMPVSLIKSLLLFATPWIYIILALWLFSIALKPIQKN